MVMGNKAIYLTAAISVFMAGGLLLHPSHAQPTNTNGQPINQPFPHIMYWGIGNSNGWPFVMDPHDVMNTRPLPTDPLDPHVISDLARAQLVTVPVTPTGDTRLDIVPALRAQNPNIKIFAIANFATTWCPGGGYTDDVKFYRHFFEVAMRWNTDGKPYRECPTTGPGFLFMIKDGVSVWTGTDSLTSVNYAHRVDNGDGTYTYDVAEAYADLMFQDIYETHLYDGVIFDCMCMTASWAVKLWGHYEVDYEYAGYPSVESFDEGWHQGVLRFNERFRQLVVAAGGTDFPAIGNCASPQGLFAQLNGWTRENFPYQGGGTWYTNMFNLNIGYLSDDQHFRRPSYSINLMYPTDLNSVANRRQARFGTASTALGDGYSTVNYGGLYDQPLPPSQPSLHWWMDEYSVDPLIAVATGDGSKIGWLGQPKNDYYQMILPNNNPELLPRNDFELDISRIHPNVFLPAQATIDQETNNAPVGSGALHVSVGQVGNEGSLVLLNSDPFTTTNGTIYSLTFWAKASTRRAIMVYPIFSAGQRLAISDTWKQYQVSVRATTSGTSVYQLQVGQETGDLWFDDFQIQAGVNNVYRRDFDHGIVLVNPSESAQIVPLERSYQKILGTISPEINTGASVSTVTLAAADPNDNIGDALFLVDVDVVPPSGINDLQAL